MAPWLAVLEAYLVRALLQTPAFHRGVEKIARRVHRIRYGVPPDEMGGTKIDEPHVSSFRKHFTDEIQTQLGRAEARTAVKSGNGAAMRSTAEQQQERVVDDSAEAVWRNARKDVAHGQAREQAQERTVDESADAVWRNARKNVEDGQKQSQGFMGEYVAALREQIKAGK